MSDPSSTRYRFNAGDTRRARLRIEPTAMMTGIVVLAHAALIGNAIAATEYAVDGLAVGTRLNFSSASYREYKCSPSDQFYGLIANPIDQNPWAHWRSPMDMMRQGWSTSLFHAAQQWSTRSS